MSSALPLGDGAQRHKLVVLTAQGFAIHPLPEQGPVTLGSGPGCDLRIDDPSVAPTHARLTVGSPSVVEDLGGGTTRVRERLLAPGESAEVGAGDPVHLGDATLMIEWRSGPPQRRILTDDYFELRVEEECHRAERSRSSFAVLGVAFESNVGTHV
ncbi:MAG: FHA domain-containing protein, partial [Deltaproteobacteria bacterium]|nr:FHA domain-containing protein [Deltaproteobacteria bacterium]